MIKVNGIKVEYSLFPNGEMHVDTDFLKLLKDKHDVKVLYYWEGDISLIHLYFVLNYLRKHCSVHSMDITIPYFPYSRMDRSQNDSCFTLSYVVNLIGSVINPLDHINIVEPHSRKVYDLFGQFMDRGNISCVAVIPLLAKLVMNKHPEIEVMCYPDKGARERYAKASMGLPIVYCEKVRDFDTGTIKGLDLVTEVDLTGKTILIVDDLCSKGGTFYHTANKLKEAGAKAVFLAVCHMEEAVIDGELVKNSSPIEMVYTTNTMLDAREIGSNKIYVADWMGLTYGSYFEE